jgi:ribonuclease HIII
MNPFVVNLENFLHKKLRDALIDQGFELHQPPYTLFQGKKSGISCTLYTSGKLVIQGKNAPDFIQYYIEPELLGTFGYGYEAVSSAELDKTPRIGVDESGKGDFFGPLCIAGVFAGEKEMAELLKIGVKDSKKLSDDAILKMAKQIQAIIPHHIVRIFPEKYNVLYSQFANLNSLLAWGHATVIEVLSQETGCKTALIDQFTHLPLVENALKKKSLDIHFTKKTKAESDPVVAAASILARGAFLSGLSKLSESVGLQLPKGASPAVIAAGKKLLAEKGISCFDQIAKKHFKTLDEILLNSGR